ncbi:hypothetical protein [Ferrimicrobium acidiphilum]|jgi:hypothetical protein|uniref:hypothetical protein n=2 Tax=Ferrimicrobium acidiphilum TaxID=121039 RepID=UPI0023F38BD9|nr:hypothetical protein [Ferrimicrobium acidiphilum]
MMKTIVTTTINPPTEAIRRYDEMEDWNLIVIGDRKTPSDYRLERGRYLSPADQERYDSALSDAIGWNCIQRRNFGILLAYEMGADVIALIDDDNIPQANWGKQILVGSEAEVHYYETSLDAFDPVGATNHPSLWHRGYPLELLSQRRYDQMVSRKVMVDIDAGFWNGDPDIDAICRLEHAPECDFDRALFPLAGSATAPFNSQNTMLSRRVVPYYFLYPHIGRMDDIWAAYYVQAHGFQAVFSEPSVYQDRNEHDLIRDLKAEIVGYTNNLSLIRDLQTDPESIVGYLPGPAVRAWDLYRRHFTNA